MASNTIKFTAKNKNNETEVKVIITHPMSSGLDKNKKTGEVIPAHFIKAIKFEHNKKIIFTANLGPAISKNPYLSFRFSGDTKGSNLRISWIDNLGDTDSQSEKIK